MNACVERGRAALPHPPVSASTLTSARFNCGSKPFAGRLYKMPYAALSPPFMKTSFRKK